MDENRNYPTRFSQSSILNFSKICETVYGIHERPIYRLIYIRLYHGSAWLNTGIPLPPHQILILSVKQHMVYIEEFIYGLM
jgi:hypothetical protein